MNENKKTHAPLFSIIKRDDLPLYKSIIIRVLAFTITFILAMFICYATVSKKSDDGYIKMMSTFFTGATNRPWKLAMDVCLLLAFAIAIVPAFKMKYWNMGANGQVLMGALISIILMFYLNDFASKSTFNNILLILLMLVSSIAVSILWAVIPAIFKVYFNTNETLFTLMMNYVASGIVGYVNYILAKGKEESPGIINLTSKSGWLPTIVDKYFIAIVIIILITVFVYFYMKKTKHGYEISVVGDSINTAKYVGMNTKKIIIRTICLSGAICGIIGFIYASSINHSISANTCGSLGFTGVLVAWLANFSPIIIAGISFVLVFLSSGTSKISSVYKLGNNDISNVIIGLLFFSILVCEFFIRFKLKLNSQSTLYKLFFGELLNGKKGGEGQC